RCADTEHGLADAPHAPPALRPLCLEPLLGIGAEKERKAALFCALCVDALEMRRHGARLDGRASRPARPPPPLP
ncbi:MAG: hypothetical protein FWF88_13875, partial [Peptococcaceae bacterium]|nr:hypothetical protein [Peptococcaceae bacterium]